MKNSHPLTHFLLRAIPACLLLTLFSACAQYDKMNLMNLQDDLHTNVYRFNKRFSGKMMALSADYVLRDKRKDFLINSNQIKDKVSFFEYSILDVQYFNGDQPVKKTSEGAEIEFNKAIATMRYQITILPSNELKTIMFDQTWVLVEEQWMMEPNLDIFLK